MSAATHVYAGDASTYAVTIARAPRHGATVVRIVATLSGPGGVPAGVVVTVPAARVTPAP